MLHIYKFFRLGKFYKIIILWNLRPEENVFPKRDLFFLLFHYEFPAGACKKCKVMHFSRLFVSSQQKKLIIMCFFHLKTSSSPFLYRRVLKFCISLLHNIGRQYHVHILLCNKICCFCGLKSKSSFTSVFYIDICIEKRDIKNETNFYCNTWQNFVYNNLRCLSNIMHTKKKIITRDCVITGQVNDRLKWFHSDFASSRRNCWSGLLSMKINIDTHLNYTCSARIAGVMNNKKYVYYYSIF